MNEYGLTYCMMGKTGSTTLCEQLLEISFFGARMQHELLANPSLLVHTIMCGE